jgi:hypothetical protein
VFLTLWQLKPRPVYTLCADRNCRRAETKTRMHVPSVRWSQKHARESEGVMTGHRAMTVLLRQFLLRQPRLYLWGTPGQGRIQPTRVECKLQGGTQTQDGAQPRGWNRAHRGTTALGGPTLLSPGWLVLLPQLFFTCHVGSWLDLKKASVSSQTQTLWLKMGQWTPSWWVGLDHGWGLPCLQ